MTSTCGSKMRYPRLEQLRIYQVRLPVTLFNVYRLILIIMLQGYTILDNLYMINGTIYVVTNSPGSVPPLDAIASSKIVPGHPTPPTPWKVVSTAEANETFGGYAGRYERLHTNDSLTDV